MTTSPIQATDAFQQLANTLMKSADSNSDGSLSSTEFTAFLTRLVGGMTTQTGLGNTGSGSTVGGAGTTGGGGGGSLDGWDTGKLNDPSHQTVKYLFGRVALNYSLAGVSGKAAVESVLNSMRADLEAAGITVLDISGDKIRVLDDSGQAALVDVVEGATGGSPAWQWIDTRY